MQRHRLIAMLLIITTAVVFSQVRHHDFVINWDDDSHVYNNPYLNPVTIPNVLHFWSYPYLGMYRPLTFTTSAAIAAVARLPETQHSLILGSYNLDPRIFHIASLVIHICNVLLVFAILRLLMRNDWAVAAGALLFAVHPVQVEPVAFISGWNNVIAGFFSLLALWQYLCFALLARDNTQPDEAGIKRQDVHYILAATAFVLALFCKPGAVSVPLIAWVLDRWMVRRPARQCTQSLVLWIAPVVICSMLTRSEYVPLQIPLWERPLIAGDTLAFYAYKIVLPWQLGIDYGRTPQWVIEHWWHLTWIVPCAIAALVWQRREKCPWLMAAAGIFIAALLPVLGLIPFRFQMYSTVADRYLYLAMLGPALGLAWLMSAIGLTTPNRIKTAWSVCVAVLCLFAVRSALQVNVWRDSMTLFQNAIQVNPRSWVAHFDLGVALHNRGDYNGAVTHFNQALQITPDYIPAYTFSGMTLLRQGKTDAAIQQLQEAIKIGPNYALPHVYLSTALLARGRSEEAMAHLQTALRLMPDSPGVYASLGIALVRQNRIEEANAAFRKSWELQAHPATTDDSLGNTLAQKRYLENVIAHELDSHYAAALNRCAIVLQRQGKREEATVFSQEALRNKVNPD